METSTRLKQFIDAAYSGNASFLARDMGVTAQAIHNYLSGRQTIGTPFLIQLWERGLSTEYLLYGVGNIYARNDAGKALSNLLPPPPDDSDFKAELLQLLQRHGYDS